MTSSIKQLLVHLDPTPAARQRLQVALGLAQQQGARLSALYATMPLFLAASVPPDAAAAMAMDSTTVELDSGTWDIQEPGEVEYTEVEETGLAY